MPAPQRPFVDFRQVKSVVSLPDVLEVFGLADRFRRAGDTLAGVCPLPQHAHGPYPNADQFKARPRDGIWVWHCFGDCHRGGDVVEFVRLMTDYGHAHVRLWFAEHFGDRLSLTRPKHGRASPPPKETAREVAQTPQRASSQNAIDTLPAGEPPIKPLRFKLKLDPDVPYLRRRGVTPETAERYGLGLCGKGLLEGYVAIPVYRYPKDANPVAYLGRWPGDDHDEAAGRPRYKWPAGFPKHRVVYGLAEALDTPPNQPLIVVEGPFSVYHLVQSGFPAVALFGSSLSGAQADLLAAARRPLILMFDGDEAGQTGMRAAAERLFDRTFGRLLKLPPGRQPDGLSPAELDQFL